MTSSNTKLSFFLFFTVCCFVKSANAQEIFHDVTPNKQGDFMEKIWYGGSLSLGLSGNTYTTQFNFGLFPMVGYKVTPTFSVGPRVGLNYNYIKINSGSSIYKFQPFEWSVGLFARQKVYGPFLAHLEVEHELDQLITYDSANTPSTIPIKKNNFYLGAGYNPGGYEILVLYNVLNNTRNTIDSPFEIRFGITINY